MVEHFVAVNGIRIHALDHEGGEPPLVFLPGLSANARSFDGLIQAGLSPRFRVVAVDLRGRGSSDKPDSGYSMSDHASDVIGLFDSLGLEQPVVCGHSFGGLLTLFLASQYPNRVSRLVILDSSSQIVNPTSRDLIKPSLARLDKVFPSWEVYLDAMKNAPQFHGWWDPTIESYYQADVEVASDGSVRTRARYGNIAAAIDGAAAENWDAHVSRIRQPALLLRAPESYGLPGAPPMVPLEHATRTVEALADCRYAEVPGNHMTMMFGEGAKRIVAMITEFV
ncbi:MAG TPA: alpha/beta hydrolase [Blastocatellia bacterium]|nr:alpha/beta hydrolase [Blastocatellia bacterium]